MTMAEQAGRLMGLVAPVTGKQPGPRCPKQLSAALATHTGTSSTARACVAPAPTQKATRRSWPRPWSALSAAASRVPEAQPTMPCPRHRKLGLEEILPRAPSQGRQGTPWGGWDLGVHSEPVVLGVTLSQDPHDGGLPKLSAQNL